MGNPGKPLSEDGIYAKELGIKRRRVQILGGAKKLRSLSPEARAVLLGPTNYGNSQEVIKGGLRARGMKRAKDIRIQNE